MNRIKELRQAKGLSLRDMSEKINMSYITISQYERGKREPKLETWQKLADFFGVSVPYLQGISKVKDVDAFDDFKSFLDYLSKIRKLPDRYSVETDELLAFYAENDRRVFKLLGDVFLKLTRTKRTHKALEKAVKDISENSDIQDISEINSIMLDVFVIMLQSETNVEKSIKARKKIIDIVETHRSLKRKDI
ncbi:helix-turn-helix domain-containing protein [Lactobacillus gasseri]|uniref:Transcriptional regulator n=2 Tax=Lactobacillus TaxID=1578 RepID=A0AB33C9T6_LACGS|nr:MULTISPECIES: helix-turn-helix domain-containing protein [Lactobacillus]ART97557.1 transcriptional regulator [Lactobacillus gasseri]MCT7758090.1 helix-turn-helix domain-containing protein [Lactobacillus gasseri]MCZ3537045.1 helix-turn-helix domain-containing protein [Lactobacillus gasseri]MCZ3539164.1 helix-turn-helix domain-containing protein [Lactobacillus gasseri]MCZ3546355.1 helix-turn-helix domain-containing protein [Lactobacillus gasseri]